MRGLWSGAALLLLVALGSCAGCNGEPRVEAVLHWGGFRPGCVALRATPQGASAPTVVKIPLVQPDRAGERTVAVFAPPGQGPSVLLEGQAMERDCDGAVVALAQQTATVSSGGAPVTLALSADDPDDDGYISIFAMPPGTDCREGDPYVHPKPAEDACDGIDDDCDGVVDGTFGVGQPCGDAGCTGTILCAGPLASQCSAREADWYEDRDGDDAGGRFAGHFCGPDAGLVGAANDCDDTDPYVHPGAPEVCNGKDDDCNGAIDDGLGCVRATIPASANLLAVHASQRGRAWAAGQGGVLFGLTADGGVLDRSGICGGWDWRAVFVDGQDRPYLGAPLSHLAYAYDAGQSACSSTTVSPTTQLNGAWGYPKADGGTQVFMVSSTSYYEGWAPPAAPATLFQVASGNDNLRGLDGVAPYPQLTAGWFFDGVIHSRVWIDRGGGFVDQGVETLLGPGIPLYAVRMPRADLAYACGGNSTVLAFDGGTWVQLPRPSTELMDLNAITAFDERHVYVVGVGSQASWVWGWDGARWKTVMRVDYDGGTIRALAGTGPDDLWAVGKGNAWYLSLP